MAIQQMVTYRLMTLLVQINFLPQHSVVCSLTRQACAYMLKIPIALIKSNTSSERKILHDR